MKNYTPFVLVLALGVGCNSHSKSGSTTGGGGGVSADSPQPAANGATDVVWTQLTNARATGSTLVKTAGQPWLDDAGAVSVAQIASGDGSFDFTVSDANAYRFAGLGHPHSGTSAASIGYSFRVQSGRADIYEGGQWVRDNSVAAGDQLRIAVSGGVVTYYKNGSVVYTSAVKATYPLLASAALVDSGSAVNAAHLVLGSAAPALTVSGVSAQPSSDGATATVTWTTSTLADGQVELGASTSYGSWSVYAGTFTTAHSIVVDGLTAGSTYHFRVRSEDANGNAVFSDDATFVATPGAPTNVNRHRFCGWLVPNGLVPINQDPNYADFVAHADQFDAVHPMWYHVTSTTTFGTFYSTDAAAVLANTTYGGKRTLLIPTIAGVNNSEPTWVAQMLHDANLRAQHEAAIVNLVMSKKYDGIDLDYEHLADTDRDAFSTFAAELGAKLHAQGKTLSFAVGALITPKFGHWDYTQLTQSADQLHVMGYDYHYLGSHPGPVAPLGWIQQVIAYIGTISGGQVKQKFILGLPNYGIAGSDSGVTTWFGSGMDSINLTSGSYATTTTHMASCPLTNGLPVDPGRAPNQTGTAQGHVFFDDLASMEQKVTAAQAGGLGGITYWTIGGEPDRPGPKNFFDMVRGYFPR